MIDTVPFSPEHLLTLTPQSEQRAEWEAAVAAGLEGDGWSVQLDGKSLACGVLCALGDGRAAVMAFVGADAGPYMTRVLRAADRAISLSGYRRVEATVVKNFYAGNRLMQLLGFKLETPDGMRKFGARGETHFLFARVR